MKHKKHKKHQFESLKSEKHVIKESTATGSGKHHTTKGTRSKSKKEKIDIEIQPIELPTSALEEPNPRPKSATDFKYSFKDRKVSLSETRLIDKSDQKGKSMPSLHLIDAKKSTTNTNITALEKKSTSTFLAPETTSRSPVKSVQVDHSQNVPFPIITITEHSPKASMQFFDSKRSQECPSPSTYKFFVEDEPEKKSLASTIVRWKSDTEINYSIETSGESLASINYVTKNGRLSPVVILKAVHSIILRDSVCSIRICKIIFNILNKLLSYKVITKQTGMIYESKYLQCEWVEFEIFGNILCFFFAATKHKTFKPNYENSELCVHHLFMDTLFRIIKQLGCSRGCGEGKRETEAFRLKDNVMKTLKVLHEISEYHFLQYCEMLVTSHPVQEIIDIFHAFLGFCSETPATSSSTPAAATTTHLSALPSCKKSPHSFESSGLKSGYFNNFGANFLANTSKGKKNLPIKQLVAN